MMVKTRRARYFPRAKKLRAIASIAAAFPVLAAAPTPPDYASPSAWAASPGHQGAAAAVPAGALPAGRTIGVDIFYVHPTTFRDTRWNADLAEESRADGPNQALMARQAGAFNACCRVFAPWYRQASFRAFTERDTGGEEAYGLAYTDVLRAFDRYIARDNHGRPFMLVGHSQGALHVLRLLRERIDGKPLARRMVAAYAIGLAVSKGDFGTTYRTLKTCDAPLETGCVISWATFLEGSETADYVTRNEEKFARLHDRANKALVCINPLTFDAARPKAEAALNPGTLPAGPGLVPALVAGAVGARCEHGVLLVTPPPASLGLAPIPGSGNMHYHDIALFYAAIRRNAVDRANAYRKRLVR